MKKPFLETNVYYTKYEDHGGLYCTCISGLTGSKTFSSNLIKILPWDSYHKDSAVNENTGGIESNKYFVLTTGLSVFMLWFLSISSGPDGRYGGRPHYQEGYSDEESAGSRAPSGTGLTSGGGSSTSRSRPVTSSNRDHRRQQSYNQEPRRSSHKPSKWYIDILYAIIQL